MEELSENSRALYELLKAETSEEYGRRFEEYKREVTNVIKPFVCDTGKQLKAVTAAVDDIRSTVSADLAETKAQIGDDLDSLKTEIAHLTTAIGRIARPDPGVPSASRGRDRGGEPIGPDGHRCDQENRGLMCVEHASPPVGGMYYPGRNFASSSAYQSRPLHSTDVAYSPRSDLPHFDGSNPKLWQRRCEEHFQ